MLPAEILARIQERQTGVIHSSGEGSGGDLKAERRTEDSFETLRGQLGVVVSY